MHLICPECKNYVDLAPYPDLQAEQVVECNFCGITLAVKSVHNETVETEVVDEGK